ncbi:hypothetical protein NMY22_g16362 [Coprinellus aureogranulatus]|nr:hypothetical protein NMY22_g16362 [Coprinellus aureogranulatus]
MLSSSARRLASASKTFARQASSDAKNHYKVVVVGSGSGGLSVANQIYNKFKAAGTPLNKDDIAILDAAEDHFYQPGWTLVGAGLRPKSDFRRPLKSLIPSHLTLIPENVATFSPATNSVDTTTGRSVSYDTLVVAAGLQINWDNIQGLSQALIDPSSGVSSIYSYSTCDKVWSDIEGLRNGNAIFTQPAGVIKCAGAPQKIMWMAWDRFRQTDRGGNINVSFYTGMPSMFAVKKYSDALNDLRIQRAVGGYFEHNLVSVDKNNHKAIFKKVDGSVEEVDYTTLHVTPPMGPMKFIKESPIADIPEYICPRRLPPSLPTSKTAAAITAQAPVLTENVFSFMKNGKVNPLAKYDGYTSCPLLTGYGELMLAEFTYGAVPKETFGAFVDQAKPRRAFYHLKKDVFPSAYWNWMVKGKWYGSKGLVAPKFE